MAVVQYTYTHNTENVTKQTVHRTTQNIHRTTQKIHRTTQKLGRVRAVPRLCGFALIFQFPGFGYKKYGIRKVLCKRQDTVALSFLTENGYEQL